MLPVPSPPSPCYAIVLLCLAVTTIVWSLRRRTWGRRSRGFSLPPGPKPWPFIGNLLDLPHAKHPWLVYREWSSIYGALIFSRYNH